MSERQASPDPMRRLILAGVLAALVTGGRAQAAASPRPDSEARRLLRAARRWGCQYQDIDLDAVAESDLDLIALEPSLDDWSMRFITPADMERLKRKPDGSRRLVLGYLPVGEADIKRWYYTDDMRAKPPAWLGLENPNWPGSRHARYWDPSWRALMATGDDSLLRRILAVGFDGALLDRVDAYGDWREERPSGQNDMIDLVATIRDIASERNPDFLLVPQNAEDLLLSARYRRLIDGLNKESLLTGLSGPGVPNSEDDVEWSLKRLKKAQSDGVTIFATEYVSDPASQRRLSDRLETYGFKPFFGVRELDVLPD